MKIYTQATAALLLIAGLLNFSPVSSSSRGHEVFNDFDLEAVKGQLEQFRAHTIKRKDLPSSLFVTTTTTGRTGHYKELPNVAAGNDMLPSSMIESAAMNGWKMQQMMMPLKKDCGSARNRHKLQELDCSDGTTSISVTSTVFPLMEGCFVVSIQDGNTVYATENAFIVPLESSTTDPPLWYAAYQVSTDDVVIACVSAESADDVDPSNATWYCDTDGEGSALTLADEELSVSCGCLIDSPSTTPSPAAGDDAQLAADTCPGDGSFTITADAAPEISGCFKSSTTGEGRVVYTVSGTTVISEIAVFAWETDDGNFLWVIASVPFDGDSSGESAVYCYSSESVTDVNPETASWICDLTGTGTGENDFIATEDISIVCGSCPTVVGTLQPVVSPTPLAVPTPTPSLTWPTTQTAQPEALPTSLPRPAPSTLLSPSAQPAVSPSPTGLPTSDPSPPPPPTAQPIVPIAPPGTTTPMVPSTSQTTAEPAPTPAPSPIMIDGASLSAMTCSGDGSLTVTANASPNLDGCYTNAPNTNSDESLFYTVSGTITESEAVVFSFSNEDANFKWYIAYLSVGNDDVEMKFYCVSQESASDVNPGSASWLCDFTGETDNLVPASEEDISVVCGSCATDSPEGTNQDSSPASSLGVEFVKASGVGLAVVASAFAGWC